MRYLVSNENQRVSAWIAERIPGFEYGSTPYECIGLANSLGFLIAGVLFENYTHPDIHIHSVVLNKQALSREFIGEVFRYAFKQLECERITAPVPARNAAARAFDEHLGFVHEGTMRRKLPNGDDLIIYGMLREECRWLNTGKKHGYANRFPGRTTAKYAAA